MQTSISTTSSSPTSKWNGSISSSARRDNQEHPLAHMSAGPADHSWSELPSTAPLRSVFPSLYTNVPLQDRLLDVVANDPLRSVVPTSDKPHSVNRPSRSNGRHAPHAMMLMTPGTPERAAPEE